MPQSPRTTKPRPAPRQHATIMSLATRPRETTGIEVDDAVLVRLQKCLDRAKHPNSNEAEARAALVIANRIMQQYNITHADLLAQAEGEGEDNVAQYTGSSVVSIRNTKGDSYQVINEGFVGPAVNAMETFFDCKCYSTRRYLASSIEWTFYGIVENTAAAAMAFEMVYNLIVDWARDYRGKSAAYSYCLGLAEGLYQTALEEKRLETERARKAELDAFAVREREEQEQRQRELNRLAQPISDDNGNDHVDDVTQSFSAEYLGFTPQDDNFDFDGDDDGMWNSQPLPLFDQEMIDYIDLTMDLDDAIKQILDTSNDGSNSGVKKEDIEYVDLTQDETGPRIKQERDIKEENADTPNLIMEEYLQESDVKTETSVARPNTSPVVEQKVNIKQEAGQPSNTFTNAIDFNSPAMKTEQETENHAGVNDVPVTSSLTNPNNITPFPDSQTENDNTWKSEMQLVRFRETAEKAAENYLKQQKIKLSYRSSRQTGAKDHSSYSQGRRDSKKINVRQGRIA